LTRHHHSTTHPTLFLRNRLLRLHDNRPSSHIEEDNVRDEVVQARRLFTKRGWPTIDVTRRSVEETAAKVINLLGERAKKVPAA